jgi:hypothetical protein
MKYNLYDFVWRKGGFYCRNGKNTWVKGCFGIIYEVKDFTYADGVPGKQYWIHFRDGDDVGKHHMDDVLKVCPSSISTLLVKLFSEGEH